jgi:hypothetical protein
MSARDGPQLCEETRCTVRVRLEIMNQSGKRGANLCRAKIEINSNRIGHANLPGNTHRIRTSAGPRRASPCSVGSAFMTSTCCAAAGCDFRRTQRIISTAGRACTRAPWHGYSSGLRGRSSPSPGRLRQATSRRARPTCPAASSRAGASTCHPVPRCR